MALLPCPHLCDEHTLQRIRPIWSSGSSSRCVWGRDKKSIQETRDKVSPGQEPARQSRGREREICWNPSSLWSLDEERRWFDEPSSSLSAAVPQKPTAAASVQSLLLRPIHICVSPAAATPNHAPRCDFYYHILAPFCLFVHDFSVLYTK